MLVRFEPVGALTGHVYAVVVTFRGDALVVCRHRERFTWEVPAGHIEPGEDPLAAAHRELYEETGIIAGELTAIADYEVNGVAGRLFVAELGQRLPLPEFEIAETRDLPTLPEDLTYPEIQPILVDAAINWRAQHRRPAP